jgi:transcription factor CON7
MTTAYSSPPPTARPSSPLSAGAKLAYHLHNQPMDGRQTDYPQSGLQAPYPNLHERQSEASSADQPSAAQYPQGQDPRAANFSSSGTPTSEYGIAPSSARSGSFPDYIQHQQRPYHPSPGQGAHAGGMAQPTSPSMSLPDGQNSNSNAHDLKSNNDVPIDPSIAAATSPTYPPQAQYPPYTPQHGMHYADQPGVYGRPEWAGGSQYPPPHMSPYGHPASSGPPTPAMVSPVHRPPPVSCFSVASVH